jgi:hypothetical protein
MHTGIKATLVFLVGLLLVGCQPASPPITPPVIDGTLSPGEWDAARKESFRTGHPLYLMTDGEYLYVGIHSNYAGTLTGNVFIQDGDRISVLHSSAALGTAIYEKRDGSWYVVQPFTWQCRDFSDAPEAVAERAAFLEKDGWLGSIGPQGTLEELEFQIKLPREPVRLVVWFDSQEMRDVPIIWPPGTMDFFSEIPHGDPLSPFDFTPDDWAEVRITRDGRVELSLPEE